jgi:hypothetical protein
MTIEAVQAHCWRIGWQLSTCCPSSPPCPALPAGFCSEQVPEGFVAVAKNTLRVITLERVGEFFNQQSLRLRYTPRKFVIHPGAAAVGARGGVGWLACPPCACRGSDGCVFCPLQPLCSRRVRPLFARHPLSCLLSLPLQTTRC